MMVETAPGPESHKAASPKPTRVCSETQAPTTSHFLKNSRNVLCLPFSFFPANYALSTSQYPLRNRIGCQSVPLGWFDSHSRTRVTKTISIGTRGNIWVAPLQVRTMVSPISLIHNPIRGTIRARVISNGIQSKCIHRPPNVCGHPCPLLGMLLPLLVFRLRAVTLVNRCKARLFS